MTILSFNNSLAGQSGLSPKFVFVDTDNLTTDAESSGFLNAYKDQLSEDDMILMSSKPTITTITSKLYTASFSSGNVVLTVYGSGGGGNFNPASNYVVTGTWDFQNKFTVTSNTQPIYIGNSATSPPLLTNEIGLEAVSNLYLTSNANAFLNSQSTRVESTAGDLLLYANGGKTSITGSEIDLASPVRMADLPESTAAQIVYIDPLTGLLSRDVGGGGGFNPASNYLVSGTWGFTNASIQMPSLPNNYTGKLVNWNSLNGALSEFNASAIFSPSNSYDGLSNPTMSGDYVFNGSFTVNATSGPVNLNSTNNSIILQTTDPTGTASVIGNSTIVQSNSADNVIESLLGNVFIRGLGPTSNVNIISVDSDVVLTASNGQLNLSSDFANISTVNNLNIYASGPSGVIQMNTNGGDFNLSAGTGGVGGNMNINAQLGDLNFGTASGNFNLNCSFGGFSSSSTDINAGVSAGAGFSISNVDGSASFGTGVASAIALFGSLSGDFQIVAGVNGELIATGLTFTATNLTENIASNVVCFVGGASSSTITGAYEVLSSDEIILGSQSAFTITSNDIFNATSQNNIAFQSLAGNINLLSFGSATISTTTDVIMPQYGAGTATFLAGGNITSVSDKRKKEHVYDLNIDECLQAVLNATPVKFKFAEGTRERECDDGSFLGFYAQDIQKAHSLFEEVVDQSKNGDYSLGYHELIAVLFGAIKKIDQKIKETT